MDSNTPDGKDATQNHNDNKELDGTDLKHDTGEHSKHQSDSHQGISICLAKFSEDFLVIEQEQDKDLNEPVQAEEKQDSHLNGEEEAKLEEHQHTKTENVQQEEFQGTENLRSPDKSTSESKMHGTDKLISEEQQLQQDASQNDKLEIHSENKDQVDNQQQQEQNEVMQSGESDQKDAAKREEEGIEKVSLQNEQNRQQEQPLEPDTIYQPAAESELIKNEEKQENRNENNADIEHSHANQGDHRVENRENDEDDDNEQKNSVTQQHKQGQEQVQNHIPDSLVNQQEQENENNELQEQNEGFVQENDSAERKNLAKHVDEPGKSTRRHLITELEDQNNMRERKNTDADARDSFLEGVNSHNLEWNKNPLNDTSDDRGRPFQNSNTSEINREFDVEDAHDYNEYELQLDENILNEGDQEDDFLQNSEMNTSDHANKKKFLLESAIPQPSKNKASQKREQKQQRSTELHDRKEIEENIRKHRLQEVLKQKKELEEKLQGVSDQIIDLSHSVDIVHKISPKTIKKVSQSKEEEEEFLKLKAQQLVKKLEAERRLREQREQQRLKQLGKLVDREFLEMRETREERKLREAEERQEEILRRMEQRERLREEREARLYGVEASYHARALPLYKQLEQQKTEAQLQELERRKQYLAERRELYKPFQEGELEEHEKKWRENHKYSELEKRKQSSDHVRRKVFAPKQYQSILMRKVQQYDKELKESEERKDQERKVLNEKRFQYAKAVKEVYLPDIKEKESLLQNNIKNIVQRTETLESYENYWKMRRFNPNKVVRSPQIQVDFEEEYVKDHYGIKTGTNKSTNLSRSPHPNGPPQLGGNDYRTPKAHSVKSTKHKVGVPRISQQLDQRVDKSVDGEISVHHGPEEGHEAPSKKLYPNYIEELKKKRQEYEDKGLKYRKQTWEKHLKDNKLSYAEKVNFVLEDVKSIEEKAKEREARLRESEKYGTKDPKEQRQEIDNMYADSIRAKIALLGGNNRR